ncbi:MAG: DUF4382 domain-containing protein [bacterium]|nr:DUF4382 domain-containing protein [bacterium]
MSKNVILLTALVIMLLGAAFIFLDGNQNMSPTISVPATGQGRAVIGVSDAAMDMQGVSSVMITVDKVEVQSAAQGWVTVSSASKQYDLLQLKQSGAVALLADVNLPVGTYNQIRLAISKVDVTFNGTTQRAKLPSETLKIVGRLVVEDGKTATAVLDFKADKSLHATGNGRFVIAPVVNFKTKSDVSVEVKSDNTLKIDGGKDEDEVNVGMDEHGEIKNNFELGVSAKIEIDVNEVIQVIGKNDDDEEEVKLNLSSQNRSGIAGTATLENKDGKVEVKLELTSVPTGVAELLGVLLGASHPAHIHLGSCANLGAVKYPLGSTVNGKSETSLNASLADLKAQLPLAINVHKSPEEIGVYIACGDIKL